MSDTQGKAPADHVQTVELDALILSALDARDYRWSASDIVDLTHGIAHYLTQRGVVITCAGEQVDPGIYSPHRWRRMVEDGGLLDDEPRPATPAKEDRDA
jgi:hypothetical protein